MECWLFPWALTNLGEEYRNLKYSSSGFENIQTLTWGWHIQNNRSFFDVFHKSALFGSFAVRLMAH